MSNENNELQALISEAIIKGDSIEKITRKIFLLLPSHAFKNQFDLQLDLLTEVSEHLNVPISSVHIVGSAKTGVSLVKGTPFSKDNSDIDIAVVDPVLYMKKFEYSFKESNGWALNSFTVRSDVEKTKLRRQEFLDYLQKGIFRPDKMPNSSQRADWLNFFGRLTGKYANHCNKITAWVYASEIFLTSKQQSAVSIYLGNFKGNKK